MPFSHVIIYYFSQLLSTVEVISQMISSSTMSGQQIWAVACGPWCRELCYQQSMPLGFLS